MGFVENLILFLTVQNGKNWITFDKVITDYVMSLFFMDHGVFADQISMKYPNPPYPRLMYHTLDAWLQSNFYSLVTLMLLLTDLTRAPDDKSISIEYCEKKWKSIANTIGSNTNTAILTAMQTAVTRSRLSDYTA